MFANDECGKAAKSIDLVSDPGTLPAVPSIVADEEPARRCGTARAGETVAGTANRS